MFSALFRTASHREARLIAEHSTWEKASIGTGIILPCERLSLEPVGFKPV